ncbi:MAG: hypothetical protein Q8O76_13660 [Chloroflexota bacterium]|nr:hypothetical protein [Chloroflexota bacterium]
MKKGLFLLGLGVALFLIGLFFFGRGTASALDKRQCLACHGVTTLKKGSSSGPEVSLFVNAKALDASAHRYTDCTTCHTQEPHAEKTSPRPSLSRRCGTCHEYQMELHETSIHAGSQAQENLTVASCVDCHSTDGTPHGIQRVLSYDSPAYLKKIAQTCTRCHGDERLMRSYGSVEKTYETYMRSFHGRAIMLGSNDLTKLNAATCTSCHGTHDIKKAEDPASPVSSLSNLARTCEQCHPGAGVNFAASFMGHREASPENFPLVYFAERFFTFLFATVVAFGIFLVGMKVILFAMSRIRGEGKP